MGLLAACRLVFVVDNDEIFLFTDVFDLNGGALGMHIALQILAAGNAGVAILLSLL